MCLIFVRFIRTAIRAGHEFTALSTNQYEGGALPRKTTQLNTLLVMLQNGPGRKGD